MSCRRRPRCSMALAALLAVALAAASADDWPWWRGTDHDSTTAEVSGWRDGAWDLKGPVWSANVGAGGSSPVVADGTVYVVGWEDETDTVRALDLADGGELWRQTYRCPRWGRYHKGDESLYGGPSATPAFDRGTGLLYTLSIDGNLRCWDTRAKGRGVWGIDLYERYGVGQRPDVGGGARDYGYTTCPLIHRDWLIVEVGAPESNLIAFDKRTGEERWRSDCKDPAGSSGGPVPVTVEGIPCAVILTLTNLVVVRLDGEHAGETLASTPWQTDYANSIANPTVHGNSVIVTSGYNVSKIARFDVSPAGMREVWSGRRYSKVCSPVVHDGRVFHAWQKLWCLDFSTGEAVWSGGRFGDDSSCLVTGDGRLLVLGQRKLALIDPAADEYRELATKATELKGRCWPHLILAEGKLLAKDADGNLICFRIGD